MRLIEQDWQWVQTPAIDTLKILEYCGRVCYKSEGKIKDDSAEKFVRMILKNGHHSVIEHVIASVKLITNRSVSHELVRHRLCSFSQESTRYVRYSDMEFIKPVWYAEWDFNKRTIFETACMVSELKYKELIKSGATPEQAREILPNSLKTELIVTANLREWRHIFKLRCSKKAHPQIRALMQSVLIGFQEAVPVLFEGINEDDRNQ